MKRRNHIFVIFVTIAITIALLCGCSGSAVKLSGPEPTVDYRTLRWEPVEHAVGYVVACENKEYEVTECEFDLSEYTQPTTYYIEVMAIGDGVKYLDSEWVKISYKPMQATAIREGYDENGLRYTLLKDLSGYEVSAGKWQISETLKIQDYFGGLPVTKIADLAFSVPGFGPPVAESGYRCNDVTTELILPGHLEEIGDKAFYCLRGITEVTIPESVTVIQGDAFYGCTHLRKVSLPKNLKVLSNAVFMGCALEEIELPHGLEEIGPSAFNHSVYGVYSNKFTKVIVPDTVKKIGSGAFAHCENLIEIELPRGLKEIGTRILEGTAWYNAQPDGALIMNDNLFLDYKGTFDGDSYTVPQNVTVIVKGVFDNFKEVESITIEGDIEYFGEGLFWNCKKLKTLKFVGKLEELPRLFSLRKEHPVFTQAELPEGMVKIGDYCFDRCVDLSSIVLPDSLEIIGAGAFARCIGLKNATLSANLSEIGRFAFTTCSSLTEIIIPHSVKEIYELPFVECAALESIYYEGTRSEWEALANEHNSDEILRNGEYKKYYINGDEVCPPFANALIFYYSESAPATAGNYWHYVNGAPQKW